MFGGEAERDDVAEAERVLCPDGLVHFPADALHVRGKSEHDDVGKCALDDLGDGGGECVLRAGFGDAHIVRADGDRSDVLEVIRGLLRHRRRMLAQNSKRTKYGGQNISGNTNLVEYS